MTSGGMRRSHQIRAFSWPQVPMRFLTCSLVGLLMPWACARSHLAPVTPLVCPPNGLGQADAPPGLVLPAALTVPELPVPVPARLRRMDARVRVVIDTAGHVMRDSITVCGVEDGRYAQRLAAMLTKVRWRPAHLNNRAIIWESLLSFRGMTPDRRGAASRGINARGRLTSE
jgi:hypothetical protein